MLYGEAKEHLVSHRCQHCCPQPHVTATRANGRLSLVIQRDSASAECWVGTWRLMVAYKARRLDSMVMPEIGEWLFPVSAGPVRGARYARLLQKPATRKAKRNVMRRPLHSLDVMPVGTNHNDQEACDAVINIYARTALRISLQAETRLLVPGAELRVRIHNDLLTGKSVSSRSFARLIAPNVDLAALVGRIKPSDIPEGFKLEGSRTLKFDQAKLLALVEKKNPKLAILRDQKVDVVSHHDSPLHIHEERTSIPGVYHLGVYIDSFYYPETGKIQGSHGSHNVASHPSHTSGDSTCGEFFTRLLNISAVVVNPKRRAAVRIAKKLRTVKGKLKKR